MKGDNNKDLARENLKRISASFELELLRLIRTLNLISQARELYKNQVDQFQQLTDKYKFGLSDFTIRLLDAERKSREASEPGDDENLYAPPTEHPSDTGPIIEIVDEFREYLDGIGAELERSKTLYINKLDSIYSVYNLELGASQKDLDMKLLRLQKEIARIAEANSADDKTTRQEDSDKIAKDVRPATDTKTDREKSASEKTVFKNKNYADSRESKPVINLKDPSLKERAEKPAPDTLPGTDVLNGQREEEPKMKHAYVAGAVLLIIGVIMGVVFYDILLKRWGFQEYADVENIESYTPAGTSDGNAGLSKGLDKGAEERLAAENHIDGPKDNIPSPDAVQATGGEEAVQLHSGEAEEVPGGGEFELADTITGNTPQQTLGGDMVEIKTYTVKGSGANIRNGPGVNYDIVTVVRPGQEFQGTGGQHGHWITILTPDGREGWVSGKIIKEVK